MYFTGTPSVALKTSLGACCSSCAKKPLAGFDAGSIVGVAALVGVTWLIIKSMKRVAR